MTDVTTQKPLSADGGTIDVSLSQLSEVQQLLDNHHIRYWLSEDIISVQGGPEITFIELSLNEDPAAVQAILDSAP